MPTRLIQLIVPASAVDTACKTLDDIDDANWWLAPLDDNSDRRQFFILAKPGELQTLLDDFQNLFEDKGVKDWRLLALPIEAMAPEILTKEEQEDLRDSDQIHVREELVTEVQQDGTMNRNFLLLCALSTLVAALGLTLDNVPAVIGAMVIAPLLGPLMAFSLGVALGARSMMWHALVASIAGLAVCAAASATLALILPFNEDSRLLDYSQPIPLRALILPICAGAAAALLTATNKASGFVGVAVAAALLPPIAACGLLAGAGNWHSAARAAFTVLMNVVGITLAAQIVFMATGVRPRRWSELKAAETSRYANLATLGILTLAMMALVFFWNWI